jgi:nitroreductase
LWEQQLSAGAAAMNLLHATHAMGFVGGWITGWAAYSETVRAAFCAPGERLAGFFFLGSPGQPLEERPRPSLDSVMRRWAPPGA